MNPRARSAPSVPRSERGISLVELMIALVVLSLGVLAMARVFPAGSRGQLTNRLTTTASYYAQEKIEELEGLPWSDQRMIDGNHGPETLGVNGTWTRSYTVTTLAIPLDNLKKVVVTVNWTYQGARSVIATTYLRR